ncbi:MAG: hypothetical protein INQ03_11945 [Candidatus Heimdallarchaeota archaeon]|nr:hypothetical protein [Candidatus Heimdallarchaeota archaeon]
MKYIKFFILLILIIPANAFSANASEVLFVEVIQASDPSQFSYLIEVDNETRDNNKDFVQELFGNNTYSTDAFKVVIAYNESLELQSYEEADTYGTELGVKYTIDYFMSETYPDGKVYVRMFDPLYEDDYNPNKFKIFFFYYGNYSTVVEIKLMTTNLTPEIVLLSPTSSVGSASWLYWLIPFSIGFASIIRRRSTQIRCVMYFYFN